MQDSFFTNPMSTFSPIIEAFNPGYDIPWMQINTATKVFAYYHDQHYCDFLNTPIRVMRRTPDGFCYPDYMTVKRQAVVKRVEQNMVSSILFTPEINVCMFLWYPGFEIQLHLKQMQDWKYSTVVIERVLINDVEAQEDALGQVFDPDS